MPQVVGLLTRIRLWVVGLLTWLTVNPLSFSVYLINPVIGSWDEELVSYIFWPEDTEDILSLRVQSDWDDTPAWFFFTTKACSQRNLLIKCSRKWRGNLRLSLRAAQKHQLRKHVFGEIFGGCLQCRGRWSILCGASPITLLLWGLIYSIEVWSWLLNVSCAEQDMKMAPIYFLNANMLKISDRDGVNIRDHYGGLVRARPGRMDRLLVPFHAEVVASLDLIRIVSLVCIVFQSISQFMLKNNSYLS
jgi:hypothetical protein